MNVNTIGFNFIQRPPMVMNNKDISSGSLPKIEPDVKPPISERAGGLLDGINIWDVIFKTSPDMPQSHIDQIDMSMLLVQTVTKNKTRESERIGFSLEELTAKIDMRI